MVPNRAQSLILSDCLNYKTLSFEMCICVCYFLSPESLLTERNKCNARVQFSYDMLREFFCIRYLCRHVKDIHRRNLQAGNCAEECQLNRAKPGELKDNSYKLSKNQR